MRKRLYVIFALAATIGNFSFAQASNPKEKAFLYVIKHADAPELKALAFALAKAGYKRSIEVMKPVLEPAGLRKLEQTLAALEGPVSQYASNTRFQLAKEYALSTFNKMPYRFQRSLKASEKKGDSEKEGRIGILNNELYILNKPYQYVVRALKKKNVNWPDDLKRMNFKTVFGGWSSFTWQAQSA